MTSKLERTRLPGPIQAIAWNADSSSIAVSHCGNDVIVYEASVASSASGESLSWTKVATLQGHDMLVSGLDWAPQADLILSCSHDRNAFVWTRAAPKTAASGAASSSTAPGPSAPTSSPSISTGPNNRGGGLTSGLRGGATSTTTATAAEAAGSSAASTSGSNAGPNRCWEKQMVITRLTKGALCVRWSPSERKFAIGSAARTVSIGYYDPESQWWACKMIRKAHESSVVSVSWHPNSVVLATGSTDRRVRLFNVYVQGYEPEAPAGSLPDDTSFGDCIIQVAHDECGWVHDVVWTAGDLGLLYTSHDGVVGYVRGPKAQPAVRLSTPCELPLKCLAAVTERLAVGAGWEGCLVVLSRKSTEDTWQQAAVLGGDSPGAATPPAAGYGNDGDRTATGGMVRQLAQMHISVAAAASALRRASAPEAQPAASGHSACVTGLHVRPRGGAAAGAAGVGVRWHVASAGLDGQILMWDLSAFL